MERIAAKHRQVMGVREGSGPPVPAMDPRQARILAQQMTQGGRAGCCGQ